VPRWHDDPVDGLSLPPGSPLQVVTAQERPDLWERARPAFGGIWPEYNMHGNDTSSYFGQLVPRWARFQVLIYDAAADLVVGRGRSRLGAAILRPAPRSMRIDAPVADWEEWTGLELPGPGEYVFPGGLAPLTVTGGSGRYWEPNVWMVHPAPGG
jgi:hypothetical protein